MDTGGGGGQADSKSVEPDGGSHHPDHHNNNNNHHHHRHKPQVSRQVNRIVLLFGVIVVTGFALYRSAYPFQFLPGYSYSPFNESALANYSSSSSLTEKEAVELQTTLGKAAMADKTVIITILNGAWAAPNSTFDLFLESFRIGDGTSKLLNHLMVIAMDQKAYNRCLALHPHCYVLSTNGVDFSGEAYYMSTNYFDMMWRRIDFLHSVLKMGYNFIFTDADIMWFRDPFPRFYLDADFQIACDSFNGKPSSLENKPNAGFKYVKSNKRAIKFYEFWYTSKDVYPGLNEQDVLNKIKFDPFFRKIGLKMKFLDTAYFGGFCQPSKDLNQVCTMHANCCYGLGNKVHDLKLMLQDWRNFLSLPTDLRASKPTSWTVPQYCSHK